MMGEIEEAELTHAQLLDVQSPPCRRRWEGPVLSNLPGTHEHEFSELEHCLLLGLGETPTSAEGQSLLSRQQGLALLRCLPV